MHIVKLGLKIDTKVYLDFFHLVERTQTKNKKEENRRKKKGKRGEKREKRRPCCFLEPESLRRASFIGE